MSTQVIMGSLLYTGNLTRVQLLKISLSLIGSDKYQLAVEMSQ